MRNEEEETTDRRDRIRKRRTQQIQVLLLLGFIMDLRVFPGRSENQKFYVLGYSVMNKNDALVSKDGEFFSCSFCRCLFI